MVSVVARSDASEPRTAARRHSGVHSVGLGIPAGRRHGPPRADEEIGSVYRLRELGRPAELAARLVLVIGPAEELFWRGFVNARLARRLGRWPGAAAGSVAYAGAHVATGNFTLFGAAGVAGAYWSALAAAGMPMSALIVSHTGLGPADLPGRSDHTQWQRLGVRIHAPPASASP